MQAILEICVLLSSQYRRIFYIHGYLLLFMALKSTFTLGNFNITIGFNFLVLKYYVFFG